MLVTNVGHQEFDQTMSYIKTLTYICPAYALNMSLSNLRPAFGLEIKGLSSSGQGFVLLVLQMSSFCLLNRLKFTEKLQDIFKSNLGTVYISIWHLETLHLDKSWSMSGLTDVLSLSNFCQGIWTPTPRNKCVYHSIHRSDKVWTAVLPTSSLCPCSGQ